jgi:phosphohistidine phosphatase SixA
MENHTLQATTIRPPFARLRLAWSRRCALAIVLVSSAGLAMGESVTPAPTPPASPALPATLGQPQALPLVDPAKELKGKALVDALRKGGHVLYMRHALQIVPTPGPCVGSNLQPDGEMAAKAVGAAIRALNIPVGRVLSSEPCRNLDTAKLLDLGNVEVTIDLNPGGSPPGFDHGAARTRRLGELPRAGTNTLLVSHVHGSQKKSEWLHLELAEIIVFRPDGKGAAEPVARIRVADWAKLAQEAGIKLQ